MAQQVALPQMWISLLTAALHLPACYVFIYTFKLGYLGGAYAIVCSSLLSAGLVAVYVQATDLSKSVWQIPATGMVWQVSRARQGRQSVQGQQ
jgi:Na+-driven multidrug efflux pump